MTARSTRPLAGLLIAILAVACSGKTPPPASPASPSDAARTQAPSSAAPGPASTSSDAWLVVGRPGDDGLQVILASTREELFTLPTGVPDATWGHLITATSQGGTTVIRHLTVQPGFGGPSQTIAGAWRLPTIGMDPTPVGLSADGSTIVLVEDRPDHSSVATTSRFAILRGTIDRAPRMVELAGSFEYDALSADGSTLYVVEHLAGPPDGHYQVRAVDTATGVLRDGVVVDKANLDEAMAGWPIGQVRRADGMVFTLYRGAEHPFIHALSSADGWALCIDLPATGAEDATAALDWGLAANPADGSIMAVNATLGLAVEVGATELSVARSVSFTPVVSAAISLAKFGHQATEPAGRRLVVSPDGTALYAAGSGGIVRIGVSDFRVSGRFLDGSPVDALAVTPDGGTIYALVHPGGRILAVDAASGAVLGSVPGDGFDRLVAVMH